MGEKNFPHPHLCKVHETNVISTVLVYSLLIYFKHYVMHWAYWFFPLCIDHPHVSINIGETGTSYAPLCHMVWNQIHESSWTSLRKLETFANVNDSLSHFKVDRFMLQSITNISLYSQSFFLAKLISEEILITSDPYAYQRNSPKRSQMII